MIVKMKKVSLIVQTSDKQKALNALGEAKVFHTGRLDGHGDKLSALLAEQGLLNQCLNYLPKKVKIDKHSKADVTVLTDKIKRTNEAMKTANEAVINAQKELTRISHWGNFSPVDIEQIAEKGLSVRLYEIEKKDYLLANECAAALYVVGKARGKLLVAAVGKTDADFPELNAFEMPKESIAALRSIISTSTLEKQKFEAELAVLAKDQVVIEKRLAELENDISFETTVTAMTDDEGLALLEGYIPANRLNHFKKMAAEEGWAALYADPSEEEIDQVPTQTKQYGVGALVNPVLKMFDLTPGYREFDITFIMFFFFSIFFAMIIGDGGYGAIFFTGGVLFTLKKLFTGKGVSAANILFIWLSMCTVVWGAVTGTWFGLDYFKGVPFLAQFIRHELDDPLFVQKMTFMIGVVHLSIGHIWAAIRHLRTNPLSVPADLGNLAMVVALYYVVLFLLLGQGHLTEKELPGGQLPSWIVPAVLGGFVAVLLFGGQEKGKNPFMAALLGLANFFPTFLNSIANFSDIISYIRLYAVGLAGLAIAQSFNGMAMAAPLPATIIIMLAAHTLNIALCMLSVVVHGLRLNSLEFSNHLGLQWAGTAYKPFDAKNK